jgi:ribosomal protein S18 acetylase RimI-like enzyme
MAERGLQFWWDPFPPEEVERSITDQETFLVWHGSEVIGTIAVAWEDVSIWGTRPPDAGYTHRLAIAPGATGVGFGTTIIDMAGSFIANKRGRWIRLDTMAPDNGPRASLHLWYKRQGFINVGEVDAPIIGEHGQLISYRAILYERPASCSQ